MILTQCAVCATELGLSLGKKCGRCSTRYCGPACQKQHWEEGGHDKLCKAMKKAGGAEQYNANKNYAEAVTVAAEACADDTKGQTCYICTQALHWKTKEGLVRGCSCRGTAGFVHVSCLAEQAKILVAEAEENNLDDEQHYHGVVYCALGWACWKTYVGRTDQVQLLAMTQLGNGLTSTGHYEDALAVQETELSTLRRLGASEQSILVAQGNLACTHARLGQKEKALRMRRDVYAGTLRLHGEQNINTLADAFNYARDLLGLQRLEEAKSLLRKTIPVARRALGDPHDLTLSMRSVYAQTLYKDDGATLANLREAVTTLEDAERTARRVLGGAHPLVAQIGACLRCARAALAARDPPQRGA